MRILRKTSKGGKISESDIDIIEDFKTTNKKNPKVWEIIGHIYWSADYPEKEIYEMFEKLTDLDPNHSCGWCSVAAFYKGEENKLEQYIIKTLSFESNTNCINCLVNMAVRYSDLKNSIKCIDLLEKAKKIDSRYDEIYNIEAMNYFYNEKNKDLALESINKALELCPNYGPYLSNKGIILLSQNKIDDAEKIILESIRVGTNTNKAYLCLINLYLQKEDMINLIKYADEYLKNNKDDICIHCHRGRAYEKVGDYQQALKDFLVILDGDKKECNLYMPYLGNALIHINNDEEIKEFLDKYKKVFIDDKSKLGLLVTELKESKKELAKYVFSWIDINDLSTPTEINSYAYSSYKLGLSENALELIKKAYSEEPDNHYIIDTYACILSQTRNDEEAIKLFNKLLKMNAEESSITIDEMKSLFERNGLEI